MKEDKIENSHVSKDNDMIEISFKNYLAPIGKNPWILVSIVLVVALIGVLFMYYNGGVAGSVVSEKVAGDNLLKFIDSQGSGSATIVSTSSNESLYQVVVNYQGEDIPVYVTKDGNYLITTLIPLTDTGASSGSSGSSGGEVVSVDIGDAPVLGNVNAPVTVVEYADFSCPYCGAASGDSEEYVAYMKQNNPSWEPAITNIIKDYVDTGKVKLVSKYAYGHSGGHPAQLVAWCLNDQSSDLFWKFYPLAYSNQDKVEDLTAMKNLAKTISGVDMTKLQSCLDSGKYDSRFDAEEAEAQKYGVSGTPAFFVNGKLIEGAQPYSVFKQAIDAELANA